MFIGEYAYNIDAKKRLSIPPKFRAILGGGAVVTRGIDTCLFLYPKQEWERMAEKLAALPITKSDARGFARLMLSGAAEVEIDQLGRILLPDTLKAYAGLDKKTGRIFDYFGEKIALFCRNCECKTSWGESVGRVQKISHR